MIFSVLICFCCTFGQGIDRGTDSDCIQDFTFKCPEGWNLSLDDNDVCIAPISYRGPCSSKIIATNNTKDKQTLQSICNLKWPSQEVCERNLDVCPKFWYSSEKYCLPTPSYNGPCHKPININDIESSEKTLWSNRCNIIWPCKNSCNKNYKSKCPKDWNPLS
ncbi:signal peptide containing protein [Theileria equi strain WA]|uniref:Signal peptide containing protein n=1 Tax=Theileria equi strain WA TaxID=1537102 RepID=L1LEH3_THEEQ|nr:signal peptide containing protein [Theileria equi strain WA]EKX73741.1 signal peptide containing protein [Theileria equi strain WA]|eukprot:XP_004833193.1 signal peptide containing protein [Theileria equi strain WA]